MVNHLLFFLALASLAACGQADSKPEEPTALVAAEPAQSAGQPAAIAADPSGDVAALPDYATPYPGARIETSLSGQSAQGIGGMLSMVSKDPPDTIISHYRKLMIAKGLKLETEAATGQGMILAGRAADGRSLMVTVSTRPDGASAVALVAGQ
jgi:hypothetical protein